MAQNFLIRAPATREAAMRRIFSIVALSAFLAVALTGAPVFAHGGGGHGGGGHGGGGHGGGFHGGGGFRGGGGGGGYRGFSGGGYRGAGAPRSFAAPRMGSMGGARAFAAPRAGGFAGARGGNMRGQGFGGRPRMRVRSPNKSPHVASSPSAREATGTGCGKRLAHPCFPSEARRRNDREALAPRYPPPEKPRYPPPPPPPRKPPPP